MEIILGAILPSLCVSIIMAIFTASQKKRQKKSEQQEQIAKKGEKLKVSLLVATAKLSYATAIALQNGKTNGEMSDGVSQYREAIKSFKEFERQLVADVSSEK